MSDRTQVLSFSKQLKELKDCLRKGNHDLSQIDTVEKELYDKGRNAAKLGLKKIFELIANLMAREQDSNAWNALISLVQFMLNTSTAELKATFNDILTNQDRNLKQKREALLAFICSSELLKFCEHFDQTLKERLDVVAENYSVERHRQLNSQVDQLNVTFSSTTIIMNLFDLARDVLVAVLGKEATLAKEDPNRPQPRLMMPR